LDQTVGGGWTREEKGLRWRVSGETSGSTQRAGGGGGDKESPNRNKTPNQRSREGIYFPFVTSLVGFTREDLTKEGDSERHKSGSVEIRARGDRGKNRKSQKQVSTRAKIEKRRFKNLLRSYHQKMTHCTKRRGEEVRETLATC